MINNKAGVQAAIGSNMLQLPATFSQLAHSVHSLAALNTVPGNSYSYARPSKLQLTAGVASDQGVLPVAPPSGTPPCSAPTHLCHTCMIVTASTQRGTYASPYH